MFAGSLGVLHWICFDRLESNEQKEADKRGALLLFLIISSMAKFIK
jgi:hypothetical protein